MFKSLMILAAFMTTSAFAQNMAKGEDYKTAYKEMPDGTSRYIGKCSTHEDYEKIKFAKGKVIQKYVEPADLTDVQINNLLAKFDKDLIKQVLKTLDMYNIAQSGASEASILKDYFDDFEAMTLTHKKAVGLDLIRVGFGVGGGNGGFIVFNRSIVAGKNSYKIMSYTFDGDMNYCDRLVWNK